MKHIPLIASVQDLSGFGRCSLTAAIPVLSAMGMQVCPMPTALLSNHTGYPSYFFEDFTEQMQAYADEWEKLQLHFDAIYTGFLGNERQVSILCDFIDRFRREDTIVVIDPAMADNGERYATCTPALCDAMKRLIALGTVVTPNLTEACLLTDTDYHALLALDEEMYFDRIGEIGQMLIRMGAKQVVITGVVTDDRIHNVVIKDGGETAIVQSAHMVRPCYAGTGDVFASVLCGGLVRGDLLEDAVSFAGEFVGRVTDFTKRHGAAQTDGIIFEPFLHELYKEGDTK